MEDECKRCYHKIENEIYCKQGVSQNIKAPFGNPCCCFKPIKEKENK